MSVQKVKQVVSWEQISHFKSLVVFWTNILSADNLLDFQFTSVSDLLVFIKNEWCFKPRTTWAKLVCIIIPDCPQTSMAIQYRISAKIIIHNIYIWLIGIKWRYIRPQNITFKIDLIFLV